MRDNFSKPTILRLAKRAGFRCSNPDCRNPTIGAAAGHDGVVNIGVAAHITAASPNGPRYDPNQTSNQRSDISNGIWLCQACAKLVDDDANAFEAEVLYKWKETAEKASFLALKERRSSAESVLSHVSTFLSRLSPGSYTLSPRLGSILAVSSIQSASLEKRRDSVGGRACGP